MTHEYTLLLGATVLPGGDAPACEALAWAAGTILALGSEAEIRAISRGDSHVMEVRGRFVVPLEGCLELGAPADMAVLGVDPREVRGPSDPRRLAVIRGGHLVEGSLAPGTPPLTNLWATTRATSDPDGQPARDDRPLGRVR